MPKDIEPLISDDLTPDTHAKIQIRQAQLKTCLLPSEGRSAPVISDDSQVPILNDAEDRKYWVARGGFSVNGSALPAVWRMTLLRSAIESYGSRCNRNV